MSIYTILLNSAHSLSSMCHVLFKWNSKETISMLMKAKLSASSVAILLMLPYDMS